MRRTHESGSATLFIVAVTGLVMFVGLGLSGVATIVLTQRSAQAAADLAALAGASAALSGAEACAAAAAIAEANAATLDDCRLAALVVTVAVTTRGPRLLERRYDVTAEARAGPAASSG